jgi:hypothetical protein
MAHVADDSDDRAHHPVVHPHAQTLAQRILAREDAPRPGLVDERHRGDVAVGAGEQPAAQEESAAS